MNASRILHLLVALFLVATFAHRAIAAEDQLEFIRALQEHGYGDMAVEYLKAIEGTPNVPATLLEAWDLEMSKCLKAAAGGAFDAKEYDALMEESQKHLAKFLQEKPTHPDAMVATAAWGEFLMKRALDAMRAAKPLEAKDKAEYEKAMVAVRIGLNEAKEKFTQAEQKFKAKLAALPPGSQQPAKKSERARVADARRQAEAYVLEAQLQLAMLEYYQAQTYAAPDNPDRPALLKKAAEAFDNVYQPNRGTVTGLYAHMWHGKTCEELGELQTAVDIYDEVLANAPEPLEKGPATGLEPLFTQVEQFRFVILAKQKPDEFVGEASAWLKDYRRWKATEGYQGIAAATTKAALARLEKASPAERQKTLVDLSPLVAECVKVRGPYQQEFIAMRREIVQRRGGVEAEAKTFDEAVAIGDGFANGGEWQKASDAYDKALKLAEMANRRDAAGIAAVAEAKGRAQCMIARDLFGKGQFDECLAWVDKIALNAKGNPKKESASAAQAASLGVTAALNAYVAAQQTQNAEAAQKALATLAKMAEFTETTWPERPEADDARMARGQAKLVVGQDREAIDIFERVNPKSERYAPAMYLAGLNYWRLYLTAKTKDAADADKSDMAVDRQKAVERLALALDGFAKLVEPGKPLPRYMPETQRLMAEAYCEGGEPQKAIALYQPLIEAVKAEKPQILDSDTIRTFWGAFRAYAAVDQIDKAGEVGAMLIEIGPDRQPVNDALIGFARQLNVERQRAEARVTEFEGIQSDDAAAAKMKLESIQAILGKGLVQLAQRDQLSLAHMMFIGQTLNTIGRTAEATGEFQKILKRAEADPEFAESAKKAMSLIRTELLKVLRQQEKYDEALTQVEQLIKENPKALEPRMEKGRILESWAEKDGTKFQTAIEHWTMLRKMLQSMKKKPDEYYEVMYNVARCLVREAETTKDKKTAAERANMSEKVLKAALTLSPRLNGPDMVAKYQVLLNKAIVLQGRSPGKKEARSP